MRQTMEITDRKNNKTQLSEKTWITTNEMVKICGIFDCKLEEIVKVKITIRRIIWDISEIRQSY